MPKTEQFKVSVTHDESGSFVDAMHDWMATMVDRMKGRRPIQVTVLDQRGHRMMFGDEQMESLIRDIKRLAGIVEFVPGPEFSSGGDEGEQPGGVPMSERLEAIARGTQGVGQIDQHQIEEIFRAARMLKRYEGWTKRLEL